MNRKTTPLFTTAERIGLIAAIVIAGAILLAKAGCSRSDIEVNPERVEVAENSDSIRIEPVPKKARRDTIVKRSRKGKKAAPAKPLPSRSPLDEVL